MPRGVKKENLPIKVCIICNRPFNWRKKWEKCWEEVTTCSNSCNRKRRALKQANSNADIIEDNSDMSSTSSSESSSRNHKPNNRSRQRNGQQAQRPPVNSISMDTTTAFAYILPIELQEVVNEIRSQHDKAFNRWMPHINFVFPFVAPANFDAFHARLNQGLDQFPNAFPVEFEGIGYFAQKQGYTFHLKPTASTAKYMETVFHQILASLPELESIIPKNRRDSFHSHLTLAQSDKSGFDEMMNLLGNWYQTSFVPATEALKISNSEVLRCNKLVFLHRSPETFDKMHEIQFFALRQTEGEQIVDNVL